jgi:hypothetical protein
MKDLQETALEIFKTLCNSTININGTSYLELIKLSIELTKEIQKEAYTESNVLNKYQIAIDVANEWRNGPCYQIFNFFDFCSDKIKHK